MTSSAKTPSTRREPGDDLGDACWDDLRYCLVLAETGGLRSAAARLGTSHTTVSRRVKALEKRLGAQLFDRLPEGVRATAAGERVIEAARSMFDTFLSLDLSMQGMDRRLAGRIRVGLPDLLGLWIMPSLVRFQRAWPLIEIELLPGYAIHDLGRREADVVLRLMPAGVDPHQPDLVGRRLCAVSFASYAARDWSATHRLDGSDPSACWIGFTDDGPRPVWVQRSEFPDVPARGLIESSYLQHAAARAGLGVAQLPCCNADQDPGLVRVGERPPEPLYDLWVLVHPDLRQTARLRVFREFISEEITRQADVFSGAG